MGDAPELLPCPKNCGAKPTLRIGLSEFTDGEIQCDCGWTSGNFPTADEAVAHWNTRATTDTAAAVTAALRDAAGVCKIARDRANHLRETEPYQRDNVMQLMAKALQAADIERDITALITPSGTAALDAAIARAVAERDAKIEKLKLDHEWMHNDRNGWQIAADKRWTDLLDARAEIARLRAALTPFAQYMQTEDGRMDRDHLGNDLADDQGVGWIYLTYGDFRCATAAIAPPPKPQETP